MSHSESIEDKAERGVAYTEAVVPAGRNLTRAITPGGHPVDNSQPAFPTYHRRFADPGPLGLSAFALTTFILSLINIGARGVTTPNVVVSCALGYGGLVQLLAGMWEFAAGNTFGATVFSSYGGFWISYGLILSPWTGIAAAYSDPIELEHAIGFYLFGWVIFTVIIALAALRSSIVLLTAVVTLDFAFMLLAIGQFTDTTALTHAGGWIGVVVAFMAWYVAAAGLINPQTSYFVLPVGDLSRKD